MAVLLCSGQGAQKPHMGEDLLEVPQVTKVFACAHEILGVDLAKLARTGSADEVNNTFNAQALTVALSVGIGRTLIDQGLSVEAVLGFSLGEISGLALTGILSLEDTFALLQVRARSMDEACAARPGGMLALLGVDEDQAQRLCDETLKAGSGDEILVLANYNCPGQIVISGDVSAIERAQETAKETKLRCARLATAGGFHSPLMAQAAQTVKNFCQALTFNPGNIPLICNTDAKEFQSAQAAERLSAQIVSPVRFEQGVRYLLSQGADEFIEAGFGGVLFNLMKRIDKTAVRFKVGTRQELKAFEEREIHE